MIRVALLSPIRVYRDALAKALGQYAGITVAAAADLSPEAVGSIVSGVDVAVVDFDVAAAATVLARLPRIAPHLRAVALGVVGTDADVVAHAEAGVVAFLDPDSSLDDLVRVIQTAASGEVRYSSREAGALQRHLATVANERARTPDATLTRRELEILRLLDQGLRDKEIAAHLGIAPHTVKNHVRNLRSKLGARDRAAAAAAFRRTT